MKKLVTAIALALGISLTVFAQAHEAAKHAARIEGELVDTGCYLGHMGQGADHVGCATKCINAGMPMGVLTRQGTLYLVTMNHDNPDAYNKLKTMAGKKVTVIGPLYSRGGMKAIEATSFRLTSAG